MLILTRRIGESIIIGKNMEISVVILESHANQVRIGIEAPKDIPVHREEIIKRILNEQEKCSDDNDDDLFIEIDEIELCQD